MDSPVCSSRTLYWERISFGRSIVFGFGVFQNPVEVFVVGLLHSVTVAIKAFEERMSR
jgi:hypothetical protein